VALREKLILLPQRHQILKTDIFALMPTASLTQGAFSHKPSLYPTQGDDVSDVPFVGSERDAGQGRPQTSFWQHVGSSTAKNALNSGSERHCS
jgi:hypothetical protein